MRLNRAALLALCCLISFFTSAQTDSGIILRTGRVLIKSDLNNSFIDSFNRTATKFNSKAIALIKFTDIPSEQQRKQLASAGIELNNYLSAGVYSVTISRNLDAASLGQMNVKGLTQLTPSQKIDPLIAGNRIPAYIIKVPNTVDVIITYPRSFIYAEISQFLLEKNIDIVNSESARYGKLTVRLTPVRLHELASFAFVEYVEPIGPDIELYNHKSKLGTRANVLNGAVSDGGYGLNGEGVVLGIGDNTAINNQIDFAGRLIERNNLAASHGIHVAGTAAGGGIVNELYKGFAPKATILNTLQRDVLSPIYFYDHNMVVTNNSYGSPFMCDINGRYAAASAEIDDMANDYPTLLHIFGAGNFGTNGCDPYPSGFNTISSFWQSAKNTMCIGGTNDSMEVQTFSSKGPAKDGRIKPDIVAMGLEVTSTWPNNIYSYNSGTSMSAPAVTGGAALLYQRYRQLHNGADPRNGLIKAILCNGATDRGNPGPDYSNGFGVMNLLRSIDMINKQHHFNNDARHNTSRTHTITVPTGTAQLKVMLYWNDPGASPLSKYALVNDLDLEVVTPASNTVLPYILDTVAANVNNPAVRGVDHTNNIEQVVIDQPATGNYSIRVKGTTVAQNPSQEYFLVYDIIPVSLTLSYPVGSESMVPGESVKISWEAYGNTDKTFNLQFSPDNGGSWTDIATNVEAARRIYTWQVPSIVTTKALIRIVQNSTGLTSTSRPFTIIGLPVISLSAVQCPTYVAVNWTPVTGADHYEVMLLIGDDMKTVSTTTSTSYVYKNLSKDNVQWVAVRPVVNGRPGRRSVAISRKPDNGNCTGTLSDNDLTVEAILSPVTGRKFTSSALRPDHIVSIRVRNLDDAPVNGFTVGYALNNNWINETITASIPAGGTYDHSFPATLNLSAAGTYRIQAVVKNNIPDPSVMNDTLVADIRHLDNQVINLSNLFLDDLELATSASYNKDIIGIPGVDRYDFESVTKSGILYTFLNGNSAYSGTRVLIMGEATQRTSQGQNQLTGTFNLANYNAQTNNLRVDFRYRNTNLGLPNDVFYIRGSDTSAWIRMTAISRTDFNYRRSASLPIADTLAAHGQQLSSSFQMRWTQGTLFQSLLSRQYAIDDIRMYEVMNDLQLLSIDTPVTMSCAVTGNVPVKVTLHNSHITALTNIPIKYSVNDGQWIEEFISSIPAKGIVQYTFNHPLNMTGIGSYKLKVIVAYPSDNFRENDSLQSDIQNSTMITSFPYLQNFESGTEGWYTSGQNSSWAYGTPASPTIKGAASGARAWKTSLAGNHNDNELSYLYTPCFDFSRMARPTVSFSMALDIDQCIGDPCDAAWLEYSSNGTTWLKYGSFGLGTNWYNTSGVNQWRSIDHSRWHVASNIPSGSGGIVRFRFVFSSNAGINKEGVAIDDFHVYDHLGVIYDSVTMPSPVTETVTSNSWTHFKYSGGKILASINPHTQVVGPVDAQVYIHKPGVRSTSTQYYHNRNLTLKSANNFNDSVTVRWYFLDNETDSLILATGCPGCSKPTSAYQLGVSTYNDAVDNN